MKTGLRILSLVTGISLAALLVFPPTAAAGDLTSAFSVSFKRTAYNVRKVPHKQLPYMQENVGPLDGSGKYDEQGVAVRIVDGKPYDHPVMQAQFMLSRLGSYEFNRDPAYLDRVRAHADRLIKTAVRSRGAIYLPYPFDFSLHGRATDMMRAPWYSAMAQGQALSAFVRLYRITGDRQYLDAAQALFRSFKNPRSVGVPWTVEVDRSGYLWFEEYAKDRPDRTFNGHVFAIYGLYEYFQLTGDHDAKLLFQAGLTSVHNYLSEMRHPGWISRYCLQHSVASAKYHIVHVRQLYELYSMTGARRFSRAADQFLADFPTAQSGGKGLLKAGTIHAFKFGSAGKVADTRDFQLSAEQVVNVGSRTKIAGKSGIWLQIEGGGLNGYWVKENRNQAFLTSPIEDYRFSPIRRVRLKGGSYTGNRFDSSGRRTGAKRLKFDSHAVTHTDRRWLLNGVVYFHLTHGRAAGYWIPAGRGVLVQ